MAFTMKIESNNRLNQMSVIVLIHFQQAQCFILFELLFLLNFISLLSKPVFVTKVACANLEVKFQLLA